MGRAEEGDYVSLGHRSKSLFLMCELLFADPLIVTAHGGIEPDVGIEEAHGCYRPS